MFSLNNSGFPWILGNKLWKLLLLIDYLIMLLLPHLQRFHQGILLTVTIQEFVGGVVFSLDNILFCY